MGENTKIEPMRRAQQVTAYLKEQQIKNIQEKKLQRKAVAVRERFVKLVAVKDHAGKTYRDCSNCPTMVYIPKGSFYMGSNDHGTNEQPVHHQSL